MYDSDIGRWLGVDPKAEKRFDFSNYNYCSLNPLNRVDLDGALDETLDGWVPDGNGGFKFSESEGATTAKWIVQEGEHKGQIANGNKDGSISYETLTSNEFNFEEKKSDTKNHDPVDNAVTIVGAIQNIVAFAAEESKLINSTTASKIAYVGAAYTFIDGIHAYKTDNLNTSHIVDASATAVLVGISLFNPVGLTALTIYGGVRLIAGPSIDKFLNEKLPFKP